jgi:hypothetical protein
MRGVLNNLAFPDTGLYTRKLSGAGKETGTYMVCRGHAKAKHNFGSLTSHHLEKCGRLQYFI